MALSRRLSILAGYWTVALATINPACAAPPPDVAKPAPVPPTSLPPLPPAKIDNALAIGGEDINAKKVETRMTVDTMVNGHGPYQFIVDSGADSSVVGLKLAEELKLPMASTAILHTTTADTIVNRVRVNELAFGQGATHDLELPALADKDIGADGLIGIDVLATQRLMLDFEKRVIKAEDSRTPVRQVGDEIIITARRKKGQLILTEVHAVGLPVEAVIDTGSEITIGNLALRNQLLPGNSDKFETIKVTGVTGVTLDLQFARIGTLRIGSITLENVPMAFADVPPFTLFGLNKRPALLLGTDLLSIFRRVSLDFDARKVRFQLRKCGTSGIYVNLAPSMDLTRIRSGNDAQVCS